MVLLYIILLFLYLMLVLFLQQSIMTVLFLLFQYNLNAILKFPSFLLIVLNYIRFCFLICLSKISILIHFHLCLVCPDFYITYFLFTMVEKCYFLIQKFLSILIDNIIYWFEYIILLYKNTPQFSARCFYINWIFKFHFYYNIFIFVCLKKFVEKKKNYC